MFKSSVFSATVVALFLGFLCSGAGATEIGFNTPGASRDFRSKLQSASLSISAANRENVTPQDMLAAAQADYAKLIGVLYAAGYFGGVISIKVDGREAANIPPLTRLARVDRIELTIGTGKPFVFSKARVAPLAPGSTSPSAFKVGNRARGDLIRDAASAGVRGWRIAGHAKAKVGAQTITADHKAHDLAVDIALDPGPRLTFGNLMIHKTGRVRAERIQEIAGFPTGETYSPDLLKKSADRLRRSGAFQSVALEESETIGPSDTLDVTAKIADARPRRLGLGAALSSLEGLTLSGFWMHRNLFGGAERLRIEGEIGGIGGNSGGTDLRFSTRYERPATFTPDTNLFLRAKAEELDDTDYRERSFQFGGGLSHLFSDVLSGEAGVALQFADIDDALGSRTIKNLIVPLRLTWDKRDNSLNSTKGFYLDLQGDPFVGLDDNTTGARVYADARGYRRIGTDNGLTFATRLQIGTIAGANATDVPPDMLFFSGGAGTVRGHSYQSLAIDLGSGLRIGGRSFSAISGELRKDLDGPVGLVAFADTGFVGEGNFSKGGGGWHSGAGIGIRYATGVGPIRVDVASPLGSDLGKKFEIYVGIGQAF